MAIVIGLFVCIIINIIWQYLLNLNNDFDWKRIYSNFSINTKDNTLIWFINRIVHYIFDRNNLFTSNGHKNDPNCCFWNIEIEAIKHVFYDCHFVKRLWD